LFITPVLAIRSLALLVIHVLSLISIPPHLVNTIWTVIYVGWLMLDPTLCYVALYALLGASGIPAPLQFRQIIRVCFGFLKGCCDNRKEYKVKVQDNGTIVVKERW
jgi:hypothetical protein